MPRSRPPLAALAVGLSLALAATMTPSAVAAPSSPVPLPAPAAATPGRYIVSLAQDPIATYDGDVAGLRATRPTDGRRVDANSTAATRYRSYLTKRQTEVAASVGAKPVRRYAVSLNAFTATLTPDQVSDLERKPGVVSVSKDVVRQKTDDKNSVDYLKLSGKKGLWAALGGKAKAGRGVVVGVLDTGIWPESASFSGKALGKAAPTKSDPFRPYRSGSKIVMKKSDGSTFTGTCQTGEEFTAADCNTKLVGARYFSAGWEAAVPEVDRRDYRSPRDGGGHGSHTASTAAGNADVAATVDGVDFGSVSGVAPAAKVAAYKVLWEGRTAQQTGGWTSDIVAAIDAAVSDGVDVINYSIGSGSESAYTDPIQLAFLSAASAGIFVAASAGNSGPGASTLDNTSPWLTTVAASTVAPYQGTVQLGNGAAYAGISTTVRSTVGPAPLVTAAAVKTAAAAAAEASLCAPDSLDPAKTAGTIVVCDRGTYDRVAKSAEVERAGGVGMVLVNLTENSLDGDIHTVPTVHLNPPASNAVRAYAETAGATATLVQGNTTSTKIPYPQIAGFSSRGPSTVSGGDLIKPDIAAPGVSILAAVAPPSNSGRDFDFYSGTSMAAPHIAGLAALHLGQGVHPKWSPMRIKSALMTTARNTVDEDGSPVTDPFAQGAGEVNPSRMFNPGLVYRSSDRDWLAYLEGVGVDTGTGVKAKDPSNFNTPSIAIGSLLDTQTVTRRVTADKAGLYRAKASVPGVKVKVSPSILNFDAAGQTKSFTVTFSRKNAAFGRAATGFLTWTGAGTSVRSPIAVTPKEVSAPAVVTGTGSDGQVKFSATPGYRGSFPVAAYGLTAGESATGDAKTTDQLQYPFTVPAGTRAAQFSVRSPNQAADLDLAVYQQVGSEYVQVASSATEVVDETVRLAKPQAGRYIALVSGYANAPGTTSTPFTFQAAAVTKAESNFSVSPTNAPAVPGQPVALTARWSGLQDKTYAGWIEYRNGSGTFVTIN